ncbi:low temperature requirement protein A [Micromonospora sp. NPDC048830]|uniref:low temperature requirement protein A n=1 Tax=Micromonospora sp. NPDC048830 TaxID=3364257 RepID=UPI00371E5E85
MGQRRRRSQRSPDDPLVHRVAPGARVDRLELFFDLVFVYAFFSVTNTAARELNAGGLLQGLLMLALLWWSWCAHTVVANRVRLGEGIAPPAMFGAMAAVFVIALAVPHAFEDQPGGLYGPLIFAVGYFAVRSVHLVLHWYTARGDPPLRRQLRRLSASMSVATALLVLAAYLPEHVEGRYENAVRFSLWILAVAVEYGTGLRIGLWGWAVASAGHWVERFELIVIVAFGESIISIGVGSELTGQAITWLTVVTAMLGITVIATLWWAYFDLVGPAALHTMHGTHGTARVALARDGYIYLHLPMIAGLITLALGAKPVLHHLGTLGVDLRAPLPGSGVALGYGGVALYLLGLVGFQLRVLGTLLWTRLITIVLVLGLTPVAVRLPALAAVAVLTAVCLALLSTELVVLRQSRHALHDAVRRERAAHEARETEWRREPYG